MKANTQKPEPRDATKADGSQLDLHSIFYTVQGEGPFSGIPAIFIRLAGCNLACRGCDTAYTDGRELHAVEDIVNAAVGAIPASNKSIILFVITGGEPFRQNITPLVHKLREARQRCLIQVETNGTFNPTEGFPNTVKVVCSPKTGRVAEGLKPFISAYKYVIESGRVDPDDGMPTSMLMSQTPARPHEGFQGPVYVTPFDAQDKDHNELNTLATAQTAMRHGYIAQLQLHKLLNLP
jgi:organic radical activating enzyme